MNYKLKKILLFTAAILCFDFSIFAKPKIMFDVGKLSLPIVINDEEISFCPTLVIPELYLMHEKTGLYFNYSPFEIRFKYSENDYRFHEYTQNWQIVDVSFVNANFGYMKQLHKNFLLETYVRVNTASAMDIESFSFSPTIELSLTSSLLDEIINPENDYFMPKVLSLQAGARFNNKNDFKPGFFVTTSIDFVLFAGIMSVLFHI